MSPWLSRVEVVFSLRGKDMEMCDMFLVLQQNHQKLHPCVDFSLFFLSGMSAGVLPLRVSYCCRRPRLSVAALGQQLVGPWEGVTELPLVHSSCHALLSAHFHFSILGVLLARPAAEPLHRAELVLLLSPFLPGPYPSPN